MTLRLLQTQEPPQTQPQSQTPKNKEQSPRATTPEPLTPEPLVELPDSSADAELTNDAERGGSDRPVGEVSPEIHCIDRDKDGHCANKISPLYQVDCDDNNKAVYPGQVKYFDKPRKGGVWDYNCDGKIEKELPLAVCFSSGRICLTRVSGLKVDVGCGQDGAWADICLLDGGGCEAVDSTRNQKQKCR